MPEITLPDVSLQWSSGGDILKPSDTKIQQGWAVEIPPRQWFNWLDNRQDQAIAHIAQHGISVWSPTLEYQANKSYVQGSDGIVYKAITTNTNINPVGGPAGNWQSAFLTADQGLAVATAAQARAMTANNVAISPLQLSNAFTGNKQNLATNGWQDLPGGLIIQWGSALSGSTTGATINYPKPFPNAVFSVGASLVENPTLDYEQVQVFSTNNTSFLAFGARNATTPASINFRFLAVGY